MKILWINGNLGNQVFYSKFASYLQNKFPKEKVYSYTDPNCPSVKVHNCFGLSLPPEVRYFRWFCYLVFHFIGGVIRRLPPRLKPSWYCDRDSVKERAIFFGQYFQDKYYYLNESSDWLNVVMPDNLSEEFLSVERCISTSNSICIHVRRGDYIKEGSSYVDLTKTDYYRKAICFSKEVYPDGKLFFFSDDLSFVRDAFSDIDATFVDCNTGSESYLDIKLMSLAKINIIANSTFSYWGAYINHEHKTVIFPLAWFNDSVNRKAPDIMLENWIGL